MDIKKRLEELSRDPELESELFDFDDFDDFDADEILCASCGGSGTIVHADDPWDEGDECPDCLGTGSYVLVP